MKRLLSITAIIAAMFLLSGDDTFNAYSSSMADASVPAQWETLCDDAVATIYHAVPEQCNDDATHTASMRTIDPAKAGDYRILAMERMMMAQYGISYGDVVEVTGTGDLDGLWTVEDTMNRRYKGQHKIDLLVDRSVKTGYWKNVTVKRPRQTTRLAAL